MNSGSLNLRSINSSSLGSYSTRGTKKKESFDTSSTEPGKYSYSASDDTSRFHTEIPGTGQRNFQPQAKANSYRGCFWGVLKNFWEDWKLVNRVGGPSQETMAIEYLSHIFFGGKKMTDIERSPRQTAPQAASGPYFGQDLELRHFSSDSNRGYHSQDVAAVAEPRAPPAAAKRGAPQRMVLERRGSMGTQVTTFGQMINAGNGQHQGPAPSGLRDEARNGIPRNAEEAVCGRTGRRRASPAPYSQFQTQNQDQVPHPNNRYENRDKAIARDSFVDIFDDFDGEHDYNRRTLAPTIVSSAYGAPMSHANSVDWHTVNKEDCPGHKSKYPDRLHAGSARRGQSVAASSIYSQATDGHPNPHHYRQDSPPNMPAIPGEYRINLASLHPSSNPWQDSQPVSPMTEVYPSSSKVDYEPISPLQTQRETFVPARAAWATQRERQRQEEEEEERKRGTEFYDFYRENGPVFSSQ